jgi:hypothetical protein
MQRKLYSHCLILIIFGITLISSSVEAKRLPPPTVAPITVWLGLHEITFSVETSTTNYLGLIKKWTCNVVATNGNKELWRKKAYSFLLNPFKEQDVQEIYPKELSAEVSKIPDAKGIYNIKWINVIDEKNINHRVTPDRFNF